MVAFASQRILLLEKGEEIFGLDNHFEPLSKCNFNDTPQIKFILTKDHSDEKFVKFCPNNINSHEYELQDWTEIVYPYLPLQIMKQIEFISPDPPVWLVGQFAKYIMRPKKWFLRELLMLKQKLPGNNQSTKTFPKIY